MDQQRKSRCTGRTGAQGLRAGEQPGIHLASPGHGKRSGQSDRFGDDQRSQKKYPSLSACSFDKGFHSPENQLRLAELLDQVILPKKGRCNKQEQERENSPEFRTGRKQHSAVESGINALEVHGLDKCLDHGLEGFKRYIALGTVNK